MKYWTLVCMSAMFILASCGPVPYSEFKRDDRSYTSQLPRTITKKNFSFPRPEDSRWYVESYKEKPDSATFLLYERSETHQFKAEAELIKLKSNPSSKEAFKAMVSPLKKFDDKKRYEVIEKKENLEERQGQWCYSYYIKCWDNKPDHYPAARLMMIQKGFVLKHKKPALAVEAYYQDIGLSGEVGKKDLIENADKFLDSIIIVNDDGIQVN